MKIFTGTHVGSRKLSTQDFTLMNNIKKDSGIEIREALIPTMCEPVRISINKQQQENGTTVDRWRNIYSLEQWNNRRIEMYQSQSTLVIEMVPRNKSSWSSEEG